LTALAYPELVRHGYTQCISCHVSPNGGSLLNAYGREQAEAILSTWSYRGEGGILHGAVKDPSEQGVMIGGDLRAIQLRNETRVAIDGKFFLMQANADAAYQKDKFTAYVSVGQITNPEVGHIEGNVNSTRYYGLLQATDELSFRAGRFTPQFGLNMPDHELVTKVGTGLQPELEFDSVEAAYLGEHWTAFLTASQTVDSTPNALQEKAWVFHLAYSFMERFKTGFSFWDGNQFASHQHRQMYSLNEMFGITSRLYTLTEVDYIKDSASRDALAMSRWGYEVHKGIVPYVQYQFAQKANTHERHYAAGAQLFPRPHFEIAAQWDYIVADTAWANDAYLLLHYYF
jgi:hypothetical protein